MQTCVMAQQVKDTQEAEEFGSSSNSFSFKLYQDLAGRNPHKNVFYSPYSVSTAMAMVLLGCEGRSETELKSALALSNVAAVHKSAEKLREALQKLTDGVTLYTANRLFPEETYQVKEKFLNEVKQYYGSEVQPLDFVHNPEPSRKAVNDWVSENTQEKIKDLMPEGSITPDTVLVLANAIYFKGDWETRFKKSNTVKRDFHVGENKVSSVDMLMRKGKYNFAFDDKEKVQLLEIPYQNNTTSMLVVLPTERFGLAEVEKSLDASKLTQLQSKSMKEELMVGLPKFKLEFEADLVDSFKKLGAPSLFSSDANLGGISESRNLIISAIAHKAFIEVNEEGTEAAAATGVAINRMALLPPMEFICDHPFLFFIKHNLTNTILFAGRYVNPEA